MSHVLSPWWCHMYCHHDDVTCTVTMMMSHVLSPWWCHMYCHHDDVTCTVTMMMSHVLSPWLLIIQDARYVCTWTGVTEFGKLHCPCLDRFSIWVHSAGSLFSRSISAQTCTCTNMYLRAYTCIIYTYMYKYTYIPMHTYAHKYAYSQSDSLLDATMCMSRSFSIQVCIYVCMCMYVCTCMYVCVCMYACMHECMYVCIHPQRWNVTWE
jgi:hypothetical protein